MHDSFLPVKHAFFFGSLDECDFISTRMLQSSVLVGGPLKHKSEEIKCDYPTLWVEDKDREIYSTWELGAEEAKKLQTQQVLHKI